MKIKDIINIKELIKGIVIICSYPLLLNIIAIPFYLLLNIKLINEPFFLIFTYLLTAILFAFYYRKDLLKDLKSLQKNFKSYIIKSILCWLIGLSIMLIASYIISKFNIPTNINQQENINQLKSMPITEILCACLFAPFIEELVYRHSLSNFTTNKHLYAIFTGIIFAFIHIISSLNSTNCFIMLIYLIPYGALGISLGYAYKETNNIISNMFVHTLHNIISIIEIILTMMIGGIL